MSGGERRAFSFPTARIAPAVMFGCFAILPAVVVVAPGASPAVRAVAAVIAAALLAAAYRMARVAVVVRADRVDVRNFVRTVHVEWDDVEAFISKRWLRGTPYEIGAVRRRGGDEVLALGLTPPFGDPRPLKRVLEELEELRAEHAPQAMDVLR